MSRQGGKAISGRGTADDIILLGATEDWNSEGDVIFVPVFPMMQARERTTAASIFTSPNPMTRGWMRVRPGIELAGATDVGCQRENNEDRYSYWEPANDGQFLQKGRLIIVADGMGGYEGGQEASRIAAEEVQEMYSAAPDGDVPATLGRAFQAAHEQIKRYAAAHPNLEGMGTTCTAAVLQGPDLYYAHVGDSRLYLVREGKIRRLTRDDSYVAKLVEQGVLNPKDAEMHPQRHILTAALGAGEDVLPEVSADPIPLGAGDVLVLCTDGLWGLVSDEEIQEVVEQELPEEACRRLIEIARQRGGPDNITVQVLRVSK